MSALAKRRKLALPSSAFVVSPGPSREPTIRVGIILSPLFADLIGDRRAAHNRFESCRLAFSSKAVEPLTRRPFWLAIRPKRGDPIKSMLPLAQLRDYALK